MALIQVTEQEYFDAFPRPLTVYGSRGFNAVNVHKAEQLACVVHTDDRGAPRLGLVAGLRDGEWHCPYSAPFGEIACNGKPSLERLAAFADELAAFFAGRTLNITLAPAFYDPENAPLVHGVLANKASGAVFDFNYHYDLGRVADYGRFLDRSARKNLNRALAEPFVFETCVSPQRAYAVIAANRTSHGYSLAMSLQQVLDTIRPDGPVKADFFVLSLAGADVAAAMVYEVSPDIMQVVYWGDAPGYSALRPMNLLAHRLFEHYAAAGKSIVDVGPSSTHGVPNLGLCTFKANIGCTPTLKPTFVFRM